MTELRDDHGRWIAGMKAGATPVKHANADTRRYSKPGVQGVSSISRNRPVRSPDQSHARASLIATLYHHGADTATVKAALKKLG